MKLHDFPFSPNCRKVRAVAYEAGVSFESVPVNLLKGESRSPAFLARNPNGRVPVLEDGDFVLWESVAIIRRTVAGRVVEHPATKGTPRSSKVCRAVLVMSDARASWLWSSKLRANR